LLENSVDRTDRGAQANPALHALVKINGPDSLPFVRFFIGYDDRLYRAVRHTVAAADA
jgi:hypothetical protein